MSVDKFGREADGLLGQRSLLNSMRRGFVSRCPKCGQGRLFETGLAVKDKCTTCGETLHHHRADDLPAYLNIFIVGHVVVALTIIIMDMEVMGMWTLVISACLLALAMAFLLMRPLKGMIVGVQWALRMHGFGGYDD